jgi:hypothetical protein
MNIDDSATNIEYVLDLSIDVLNIYGASLDNMAGGAGTKTVTLTSQQRGGVFVMAREIYKKFPKDAGTTAAHSALSVTESDILKDKELMELAETIGNRLEAASYTDIPFIVATDTSGID